MLGKNITTHKGLLKLFVTDTYLRNTKRLLINITSGSRAWQYTDCATW